MARELVSGVLDLQLRQLKENGLTDLPIYEDIRAMRKNLSAVVDGEMAAVVERLAAARGATGAEREAAFIDARRTIRAVVVRLSVERQTLLRRLKAAEIAEQARRLSELQIAAHDATAALPSLPADRRPQAALQAIEDQRDVNGLFQRMLETLDDVRTWDGPIATAASDGLRVLKESETAQRLDDAEGSLEAAAYDAAAGHQQAVLEALRKLLASIETAQGSLDAQRSALADVVRQLREQQQALHQQVQQQGLADPQPDSVEAQQKIATALAELADELADDPTASPLREQAEAAASAATEGLFTADEPRTLTEQLRAIDRLTALEQALREPRDEDRRDRSAAELAGRVRDLTQARDELKQAAAKHDEAEQAGIAKPAAARDAESEAAQLAAVIDDGKDLPADVSSRLADAAQSAQEAAELLQATLSQASGGRQPPESAPPKDASRRVAQDALADSGEAFERAQAAVAEALADAQRAEAAVRVGELARAAEALERAAAAERELAQEAQAASQAGGLPPDRAAALKAIQDDITAVATKTAAGVRGSAPAAADQLSKAIDAAHHTQAALSQASGGRQPPESTPPKDASLTAAHHAALAAEALTDSAALLRREIGETAAELAALAGDQLDPVATAQQAVEQAGEAVNEPPQQATDAAAQAAQAAAQAETGATSAAQAARRASAAGSPQDASDALDRAAISLAAREQQLRQDQQMAHRIAQLASRQQSAAEGIAQARQALGDSPPDPQSMSPEQQQSARNLHAATRQFSAAQRATGQGAAQVSGQREIANVPIREALQTAERLPLPQLPGEPAAEPTDTAQASGGRQPPETPDSSQNPADASQQAASSGAPQENTSGAASAQNGMPRPTGLGTGLVPAAPDETARMMAGPEAQQALAALEAAGIESMEDVAASDTAGEPDPASGGRQPPETPDLDDAANQQPGSPADSDSQTPDAAPRDADPGTIPGEAGWFANLPPELRAAIRASSSQPAPKGYEGRLKRYFESIE